MSVYRKSHALAVLAVAMLIGSQLIATNAFAGKAKFERTKPHVNVGALPAKNRMKKTGRRKRPTHLQQIPHPSGSETELMILITPHLPPPPPPR